MRLQARLPRKSKIDMLPIMDSMFLLLVFFVYSMLSMVVQKGIPLNLPNAAAAMINQKEYTSITITEYGHYMLNEETLTLDELGQYVHDKKESGVNLNIVIRADEAAKHGWVIALMDILRANKIEKVSFETKDEQNN